MFRGCYVSVKPMPGKKRVSKSKVIKTEHILIINLMVESIFFGIVKVCSTFIYLGTLFIHAMYNSGLNASGIFYQPTKWWCRDIKKQVNLEIKFIILSCVLSWLYIHYYIGMKCIILLVRKVKKILECVLFLFFWVNTCEIAH